jgi:hypothetical protein
MVEETKLRRVWILFLILISILFQFKTYADDTSSKPKPPENVGFLSLKVLAQDAIDQHLIQPEADELQRIITLNSMGFQFSIHDPVTMAFLSEISLTKNINKVVLEIGGAYGYVAERAIKLGAKNYILNDMDVRHLKICARRLLANNDQVDLESLGYLRVFNGTFPYDFPDNFPKVDTILISKVLNYLKPRDIKPALSKLNKILRLGGLVYTLSVSPECRSYAPFRSTYYANKLQGNPFPGYCIGVQRYSLEHGLKSKVLYSSVLFFSLEELIEHFTKHGFALKKSWSVNLPSKDNVTWQPGQDMVGAVFEKTKDLDENH